MGFLYVNGYPVHVAAESVKEEFVTQAAHAERAFNGNLRLMRRNVKRKWSFKSIPMALDSAEALRRQLLGIGDVISFDTDYFTAKGYPPLASAVWTQENYLAADGSPSIFDAYFPGGSATIQSAWTNNLITLNVATGGDSGGNTTGFTAIDSATVALSTAAYWQGTKSIKVTTLANSNATQGGVSVTHAGLGFYTFTVYVKPFGAAAISVQLIGVDDGTGAGGTATGPVTTIQPGVWTRLILQFGTRGNCSNVTWKILEGVADSAVAFYIDGLQVDQTGNRATSWAGPTRSGTGLLYYPGPNGGPWGSDAEGLTINAWAMCPSFHQYPSGAAEGLWQLTNPVSSLNPRPRIAFWALAPNKGDLYVVDDTGATYSSETTGAYTWTTGAWHMVTVVVRPVANGGYNKLTMYRNGVNLPISNPNPAALPSFLTANRLWVGCDDGEMPFTSATWGSPIDDFMVLPYSVPDDMVAGWYANALYPMGAMPQVRVWGDMIPGGGPVQCIGDSVTVNYAPYRDASGGRQFNGGQVAATLIEV